MKISTKEFWQNTFLFSLVLLLAYLFDTSDALAQAAASGTTSGTASGTSGSSGVIAQIGQRAAVAIEYIKPIAYILGGFGLIGLAWGAIFGKLNWKWFGSLAIGLFLVSYMGMAIDFFVGKNHRHFSTATKFQTTGISSRFFEDTIPVRDAANTSVTQEANSEIQGEEGAEGEGTDGLNPGDEEEEAEESALAMMTCEQLYQSYHKYKDAGEDDKASIFANGAMQKGCVCSQDGCWDVQNMSCAELYAQYETYLNNPQASNIGQQFVDAAEKKGCIYSETDGWTEDDRSPWRKQYDNATSECTFTPNAESADYVSCFNKQKAAYDQVCGNAKKSGNPEKMAECQRIGAEILSTSCVQEVREKNANLDKLCKNFEKELRKLAEEEEDTREDQAEEAEKQEEKALKEAKKKAKEAASDAADYAKKAQKAAQDAAEYVSKIAALNVNCYDGADDANANNAASQAQSASAEASSANQTAQSATTSKDAKAACADAEAASRSASGFYNKAKGYKEAANNAYKQCKKQQADEEDEAEDRAKCEEYRTKCNNGGGTSVCKKYQKCREKGII